MAECYKVSFFQPQAQAYTGATFPASHGQATSFFQDSGVQQEFAFIPDDFSDVYVINVETNTTAALAPPSSKDTKARYAASITALVQLDSSGAVSYIPYKQGDTSTNSAAKWASVANIAAAVPASSASGSASGSSATGTSHGSSTGAPAGTRQSGTSTATGSAASSTGAGNGAISNAVSFGTIAAAVLSVLASLS